MTQLVPLDKRSKKARREYHAKQRGSWHGVNPITRTVQSRRLMTEQELNSGSPRSWDLLKTSPDAAGVPAANIAVPNVSSTQTIFCFSFSTAGMHQTWGISGETMRD